MCGNNKLKKWKKIAFQTSATVWGGGTAFSIILTLSDPLDNWKSAVIGFIAVIMTFIYIRFLVNDEDRDSRKKVWTKVLLPNLIALAGVIYVIYNSFVCFHAEEFVRKHISSGKLTYSGIESSTNLNIKDAKAIKHFDWKKIKIAKGMDIDERYIVGCWFTLTPEETTGQNCYTKTIEIRIKDNKYGEVWDLFKHVEDLRSDIISVAEPVPFYKIKGTYKYGHKLKITCIRPGEETKIFFLLLKNQESAAEHDTWRYAISIKFSNE